MLAYLASRRRPWENIGQLSMCTYMALKSSIYRLIGLDGSPHPVLDAPYESLEAAMRAAQNWCEGQGLRLSTGERAYGIEVMTHCGEWRTVLYAQ
ncbi:hypothetical protein [Prochlorococcus sp. MIT 1341]|uniref:hypothetical protein n=1 Tax=Prochlorococcus sp. MIT 1341 TaxID=3096221 RepID=UPI002A759BA6|nr:hypothetical protein [Prochlorococcus sp. MIT 1341]